MPDTVLHSGDTKRGKNDMAPSLYCNTTTESDISYTNVRKAYKMRLSQEAWDAV